MNLTIPFLTLALLGSPLAQADISSYAKSAYRHFTTPGNAGNLQFYTDKYSQTFYAPEVIQYQETVESLSNQNVVAVQTESYNVMSGGVAIEGRRQMMKFAKNYNLHLVFAQKKTGKFYADVPIEITNSSGTNVVNTTTTGPWLFVNVSNAKAPYTVKVVDFHNTTKEVTIVPRNGSWVTIFLD